MVLRDGPLDGEQQLVSALPTEPGSLMYFNLPALQTFDDDGDYLGIGLTAIYVLLGQGSAPVAGDTWDSSWVFVYGSEVPTPPPGTQVWMVGYPSLRVAGTTVPPPQQPQFAALYAESNMVINASDPTPGAVVITLTGETSLVTDIFPIPYGVVSMEADSLLVADGTVDPQGGTGGLVNLLSAEDSSFEGGTTGSWTGANSTLANSTAVAESGTHSLAITATTSANVSVQAGTAIPVSAGASYQALLWIQPAATARPVQVGLLWYDSGNGEIGYDYGPQVTESPGAWLQLASGAVQPVPGAVTARVQLFISNAVAGGVHYIDNISVSRFS